MKRNILFLTAAALLVLFAMGSNGYAYPMTGDKVIITRNDVLGDDIYGSGGLFRAVSPDDKWDPFGTFCIEKNEYIYLDREYEIGSILDSAVNGGEGGGNPDPISSETAFLYTQWLNGGVEDYDGSDFQQAFWHFEDENEATNGLVTWVSNNIGGWTGIGNVRVMNLIEYDSEGNVIHRQSMLTTVPEPATLMLLGVGLLGIAGYGRRKAKK